MTPRFAAIALLASLSACAGDAEEPAREDSGVAPGMFEEAGAATRGGLCIDNDGDAGFILYGPEPDQPLQANCMAEGTLERRGEGGALVFVPRGDESCAIPLTQEGDTLTFGDGGDSCAYYCGGGTALDGRSVKRTDSLRPLTDPAGDRLC